MPYGPIVIDHTETNAYLEVAEASGDFTYYGRCLCESTRSAAAPIWQIWRTSATGSTWADGNTSFDNVWADSATLVYPGVEA
jgi:hypothetical protein